MTDSVSAERRRIAELVDGRSGLAGHKLEASDIDRFVASIAFLPPPPATILDVGCGTGVLVDVLDELGYAATGMDIDEQAMARMSGRHFVGSIDAIPIDDVTFDVVVLNEVLEHLPVGVYERGLREVARVAAKSILVTVPNAESLESASTRCPACGCVYSIHGHVRRFDPDGLATLFPDFSIAEFSTVGPFKARHRTIEWYLRRRLLGRWPTQAGATCPQCGFRQPGSASVASAHASRPARAIRCVAGAPWHRWWIVARFDRAKPMPLAGEHPADSAR